MLTSLDGKTVDEARAKALKIFETLNNRGIELADADTFKALLYERARKANKEKEFIEEWKDFKNECEQISISIDDVFRHYSHIIRGRNGKVTSEINLREFFTREDYSPLNNQDYDKTLTELMKIVEILKYIKDEKNKISDSSRWLQILELYTNQYPKHALIVYLYNYGSDNEEGLVSFLIKLVRFSFYHGSTASIKFEIFSIIKKVSDKKVDDISDYFNLKVDPADYDYLGRLKNGYALLCYYLNKNNDTLPSFYVDKIVKLKDISLLDDSWTKDKINEINDSLGNMVVLDIPIKNITIDKKTEYYSKSEVDEVKELSKKIAHLTVDEFEKRDRELKEILMNFFKGNTK
jgi:hypothetical protein